MRRLPVILVASGAVLLALLAALWLFAIPVMPSVLAAWLFAVSVPAGALPILMALELAGHGHGPHAGALRRILAMLPLALVLTLPVLFGLSAYYRWTQAPHDTAWLNPAFFDARCVVYLLVWTALAVVLRRPPAGAPRAALCVIGLIVTTAVATLAASDWIGSAEPGPDLASLGLLFITSQAVLAAAAARVLGAPPSPIMALTGLAWGFIAFTRFLTVWSADKPHEIVYYQHRQTLLGQGVSWFSFAIVVISLLSLIPGPLKKMSVLSAILVLCAHGADTLWMVTPGARGLFTITAADILAMLGAVALAAGLITLRPARRQAA